MATKFTAAQLRGLKVEHEKEIRDNAIARVCTIVCGYSEINAKKGEVKYSIDLIDGENAPGVDNYIVNKEFVDECYSKLKEQLIDCIIEVNIEEIPFSYRPYRKPCTKYTITVDWSEQKPEEKKEVNELDILRAKIAELEAENTRLKAPSTVGAITNDLIDIFANFGKIN